MIENQPLSPEEINFVAGNHVYFGLAQIPKIDLFDEAIHGGNIGVIAGLSNALVQTDNATVAIFLDLVPERGAHMYERFRNWQRAGSSEATFIDFVCDSIKSRGVTMLLPKFCDFRGTDFGNSVLAHLIMAEIKRTKQFDNEILAGIHFGVASNPIVAGVIANRVCNGCPNTTCELNPNFQK